MDRYCDQYVDPEIISVDSLFNDAEKLPHSFRLVTYGSIV
jgi:hypothetical protein